MSVMSVLSVLSVLFVLCVLSMTTMSTTTLMTMNTMMISIWVTIKGGLVTRYQTKKIKFLDFLCSSDCSSIFFRIFSLIPNNASLQEVV